MHVCRYVKMYVSAPKAIGLDKSEHQHPSMETASKTCVPEQPLLRGTDILKAVMRKVAIAIPRIWETYEPRL